MTTSGSAVDTPFGFSSFGDLDEDQHTQSHTNHLTHGQTGLSSSEQVVETELGFAGGHSGAEASYSDQFGPGLSSHAPGYNHPASASAHQSGPEFGSDLFKSYSCSGFDQGESEFWGWFGLNSIESPECSSSSDVDTFQSQTSNYTIDDYSSPDTILDSPTTTLDFNFTSDLAAQPFSRNDPFVFEPSTSSGIDQIKYDDLFGLKPTPSYSDHQLFNSGSIATGLILPQPNSTDTASTYRDSAAELDALLCSPLDVSPPVNTLTDFGSGVFSPDECYSQLATPQLDFSSLNVDNDNDAAALFGPLPGHDLLVNVPAHHGMVSIKEEPEEDELDSAPATPDLEDDWAKPTVPVHNTRKRKVAGSAESESAPSSSPSVESTAAPTKRARRAASSSAPPVLALDAPIQARKYNGESKTSRKPLPKAIERSLGKDAKNRDPGDLQADVDSRRAQNTLAARKSRMRKAEEVNSLRAENEELRRRLEEYAARFGQL